MEFNRTANYINLSKLVLNGFTPDGGRASMRWGFRNSFPRITVYYTDKDGKSDMGKTVIAPFTIEGFSAFLTGLSYIVENKDKNEFVTKCYNVVYKNGERTDEIAVQATVKFFKDKDDVFNFNISAKDRNEVSSTNFKLLPDKRFFSFSIDGKPIESPGVLSKMVAKAFIDQLGKSIMLYGIIGGNRNDINQRKVHTQVSVEHNNGVSTKIADTITDKDLNELLDVK